MGFSCKNDNVNMNKLKEIKGEAYSCLGSDSSCQRDKKIVNDACFGQFQGQAGGQSVWNDVLEENICKG